MQATDEREMREGKAIPSAESLTKAQLLELYRVMVRIRRFEEKAVETYAEGFFPGLAHLYTGEEAVATGACAAIGAEDYIVSTHRGHGHVIAKGCKTDRMMAELFGKEAGYCKGKGGSMHIADLDIGILGATGIVGSGIPIAVGAGVSAMMRRSGQVCLSFFGDAASNQGTFHEALNLASVWRVPVVFVCENNQYGISVHQSRHQAIKDVAVRAQAYAMPGVIVDGNDVLAVYDAVREAAERCRAGQGPSLVECKTYRWRGHYEGDPNRGQRYRTIEEIESWMAKCPIKRFGQRLLEAGTAAEAELETIQNEIAVEIEAAVAFAKASPEPPPEEGKTDVYSAAFAYVVDPTFRRGGQ